MLFVVLTPNIVCVVGCLLYEQQVQSHSRGSAALRHKVVAFVAAIATAAAACAEMTAAAVVTAGGTVFQATGAGGRRWVVWGWDRAWDFLWAVWAAVDYR